MGVYLRGWWLVLWIVIWPLPVVHALSAADVGDHLLLKASHHDGVPVHPEPRGTNAFWRVPDASEGEVEAIEQDGHWLRIDFQDHPDGWVNRSYVIRNLTKEPPTPPDEPVPDDTLTEAERVWRSPADCLDVVESGGRLPGNDADTLRLATWNVRWFPNGCGPAQSCDENATELDWLACTLTWLAVDVVAVQEFLDDPPARTRIALTLDRLDTLTGGDWSADLQTCGATKSQRVGFLWNRAAVTLEDFADLADLNGAADPGGSACASNLRPGRYARLTSPDGLDAHLVSVHLDSGTADRDFQHRREAIAQQPACSEYFQGHGVLLDHVVVATGMQEAAATAQVSGYCAQFDCAPVNGAMAAAYERLSDHCPVLVDLLDQDLNGQ